MPRQRTHHNTIGRAFPADFPQRLVRFKEESGVPWVETARRLDTNPETVRRWRDKGVRPSARHFAALLMLADSFGLGHLFTGWTVPHETPAPKFPAPSLEDG